MFRVFLAVSVLITFLPALPGAAIVTSDGAGTHVLVDGVVLDVNGGVWPPFGNPVLDHDSVQRLFFDLPGDDRSFCTSALIQTSMGPAALTAAHCLADTSGTVEASNFEMTVIDRFGNPSTLTSTNPKDIHIHPNFDGIAWHGYDLALVLLAGNTFQVVTYPVFDGSFSPLGRAVVKFGEGVNGFGGSTQRFLDTDKRWGLNEYESYGLGDFGVHIPSGGGWANTDVQLTMDFDDGSLIDHNLFNFYGHFLSPPVIEMCNDYQSCGYLGNEVLGAPGDSGGPNFVVDPQTQEWVIVAVNSYVWRVEPEGLNGTTGNSDIEGLNNFTWGEYEGDALVTTALIDQILGLAPASPSSPVTGATAPAVPAPTTGGALGAVPVSGGGK